MAERIILDPGEVSSSRSELDITAWVRQDGIDWGNAEIQASMSEQSRGEVPIDYRVPNREISVPLRFSQSVGGTSTATARALIQSKLALFQQEGGWIKRITNSGDVVYADVVNATFQATSVTGWESRSEADVDAEATLECIPDFYGDEIQLSDHTETTLHELVFSETDVAGDYPGRVRIVIDDDSGHDQRGLIWGFRSRHYSSATSARMAIEAEEMTPLGSSRISAGGGASGGTVIAQGTLYPAFTPILNTNLGTTTYLTHTGTNRVYARMYNFGTVPVDINLSWDVGDLVNPTTNNWYRVPAGVNYHIADLGEVRLDPSPVGTHRWQGQINAQAVATGGTATTAIGVDKVYVVNQDEGAGVIKASPYPPATNRTLIALDGWSTTSAGTATGGTADLGGVWSGAGDSDDFSRVAGAFGVYAVYRGPTSADSDVYSGRRLYLNSLASQTNVDLQVDVQLPAIAATANGNVHAGVLARYDNSNNYWVIATVSNTNFITYGGFTLVSVFKKNASGVSALGQVFIGSHSQTTSWQTIRLTIDTNGAWFVYNEAQGGTPVLKAFGVDTDLATGGALATGKVGIYEARDASLANSGLSFLDNFTVYAPVAIGASDAVIYANETAQITTQGAYRIDTGGTAYGPVSIVEGDLPRIPPVNSESRVCEVFLLASRGDFTIFPDTGVDDISARMYYRPSYLFVP